MIVVNLRFFSSIHCCFLYLCFHENCLWCISALKVEQIKTSCNFIIFFFSFVLNVIVFVYNGLKQSLIQETKPNRLLQIFSFIELLCLFQNSILCCMWRLRCKFAARFVTFVGISYFASQIYVNFNRETFLVSQEKKLTKLVYFLETRMYESSIF